MVSPLDVVLADDSVVQSDVTVVDPVIEVVKICRRMGESFTRISEISVETGGAITSPLLPGFSLDVHDVFPAG
ncbi:MAG TPA: hypothetical protein VEK79_16680 [Thermoanaerobaculia bacterium]|nr:hypothetical protein [Thermoanaerobaculia bacterium]